MKLKSILLFGFCMYLAMGVGKVIAVEDPLSHENNKVGVHVLSPDEIGEASKMVNGEKGEWGYVVVPIQATDRDLVKWRRFMKVAKEKKVIPIIRVATLVDQVNWEEPNNYDLVDFANFLDDLPWPTKNRYVILFNEVNRKDEYGGYVSAEHYARILSNAITIFKERSEDFYMLPAGLDNAYREGAGSYWKDYLLAMNNAVPGIFEKVDGWVSHAYPNPGFIGRVTDRTERSIVSFEFDLNYLKRFTNKKLPVFITETGWDMEKLGEALVAENYGRAMGEKWSNGQVVVVAPFILRADGGPFAKFSLIKPDGNPTSAYQVLRSFAKVGQPSLTSGESVGMGDSFESFVKPTEKLINTDRWNGLSQLWNQILRLVFGVESQKKVVSSVKVGEKEYKVEVADNNTEREIGLSGREGLGEGEGLLFDMGRVGEATFWMKGMKFDIKIIWIKEGRVVGVSEGFYKTPYKLIPSKVPVDMVLEVNISEKVNVGDKVELIYK